MGSQSSTMKAFIFSSALLALAAAVSSTIGARAMSEESLAAQGAILVGGLCPGSPDPAACEAGLPGLWNKMAAILWPAYWDPTAEWMCADTCANPEDTTMTCDDCKMGIQAAIDQLLEPDTLDAIVENLAPEICKDNPTEECPAAVDAIIRQGLPLLAAAGDATAFGEACNAAVAGTCPARKISFF